MDPPSRFKTTMRAAMTAVPLRSRSPLRTLRAETLAPDRHQREREGRVKPSRRSTARPGRRSRLGRRSRNDSRPRAAPRRRPVSAASRSARPARPIRKRRKHDTDATMNAVIWFRVMLDAQTPRATNCAARRPPPMYSAPGRSPRPRPTPVTRRSRSVASRGGRPSRTPNRRGTSHPMISASVSGWATSHSSVFPRRSSASVRIVAAGTKTAKSSGSRSKIGRSVAMLAPYMVRNARVERDAEEGDDEHVRRRLVESSRGTRGERPSGVGSSRCPLLIHDGIPRPRRLRYPPSGSGKAAPGWPSPDGAPTASNHGRAPSRRSRDATRGHPPRRARPGYGRRAARPCDPRRPRGAASCVATSSPWGLHHVAGTPPSGSR